MSIIYSKIVSYLHFYEQKFKNEFNMLKKLKINVFALLKKCQEFQEVSKAWMFYPHKAIYPVTKL